MTDQPSITCPVCGMVSYNDGDIREGYCGNCHEWTGAIRELAGIPSLEAMSGYYDRQGHQITFQRYLWLQQGTYGFVANTEVGHYEVSTVCGPVWTSGPGRRSADR